MIVYIPLWIYEWAIKEVSEALLLSLSGHSVSLCLERQHGLPLTYTVIWRIDACSQNLLWISSCEIIFFSLFWGGKGEYIGEEKRGKTAWADLKTVWTSSDIHCCLHNGKTEPKCQIPKLCEVQSLDPSISAWILSGSQEPKCRYHILKCMKMNDSK